MGDTGEEEPAASSSDVRRDQATSKVAPMPMPVIHSGTGS